MATISINDLYQIIGAKEAYILQLQREVAALQQLVQGMAPKKEAES